MKLGDIGVRNVILHLLPLIYAFFMVHGTQSVTMFLLISYMVIFSYDAWKVLRSEPRVNDSKTTVKK